MPPKNLQPVVLAQERQDHHAVLHLQVPADLAHFEGHFADMPILPGVVQLDWAIRHTRVLFAIDNAFAALENLKFHAPVWPRSELTLTLDWDPMRHRVEFSYSNRARKYASGRVVFGPSS